MMKKRDLEIVRALEKFRALSRDQVAEMFFKNTKNPITNANYVLKRLRRDGHIEVNTDFQPFVYFPSPSRIKKDGKKVEHFLEIADFYLQLLQHQKPYQFDIEMNYKTVRPDVFMIWKGAPFWVEIQRSIYSQNVMRDKMSRYEELFYSDEWKRLSWQRDRPVFPRVWIVTPNKYDLGSFPFKILQSSNVEELLKLTQQPVKVKIG